MDHDKARAEFFKYFEKPTVVKLYPHIQAIRFTLVGISGVDVDDQKVRIRDFRDYLIADTETSNDFDLRTIIAHTWAVREGETAECEHVWVDAVEIIFNDDDDLVTFKMKYC